LPRPQRTEDRMGIAEEKGSSKGRGVAIFPKFGSTDPTVLSPAKKGREGRPVLETLKDCQGVIAHASGLFLFAGRIQKGVRRASG